MLVGQNPGTEEDKTGRPFVGKAGKYLDKILRKYDLNREKLFITSIVKHKTPKNRKPYKDEIIACRFWLTEQIRIVQLEVIVLMGKVAWKAAKFSGVEYIETYHPAAVMRFPKIRKKFEKTSEN